MPSGAFYLERSTNKYRKDRQLNNIKEIFHGLTHISNQYNLYVDVSNFGNYKNKQEIKPLVSELQIPTKEFTHKKRLFSNITTSRKDETITIDSATHMIELDKIAIKDNNFIIKSKIKTFNKTVEQDGKIYNDEINLFQIMYYNIEEETIKFELLQNTESANRFHYISKYKFQNNEDGRRIVIDPYTTEEHKILKPIRNKYIHKTSCINIFKYLNEKEKSLPDVNVNSSIEELIAKLNLIKPEIDKLRGKGARTGIEKIEIAEFKFVTEQVNNTEKLAKYIKDLTQWKSDYDEWTNNKTSIVPLEQHNVKFNRREYGEKYVSANNAKLLERLAPYDPRIDIDKINNSTIQHDSDGKVTLNEEVTKAVDFGIYGPYLVSDILRYKQLWNNIDITDKLAISEANISEFSEFIHKFKSACLSLISLAWQLDDFRELNKDYKCGSNIKSRSNPNPTLVVNFSFLPIYPESSWLVDKNHQILTSHQVIFDPCESKQNAIKIAVNFYEGTNVINLSNIVLDEPAFGLYDNSKVRDFDILLSNQLKIDQPVFVFGADSVEKNFTDLNTEERKEESLIKKIPVGEFDLETDFPSLQVTTQATSQTITPAKGKVANAWNNRINKPTPNNNEATNMDDFKAKYLKYKAKYILLKKQI